MQYFAMKLLSPKMTHPTKVAPKKRNATNGNHKIPKQHLKSRLLKYPLFSV